MKNIRIIIAILFSILMLGNCTPNKKHSENQTLSLSIGVMSSMDYLPLAVAQREGYFAKHGVDIEIQKFLSANERDVAFQSNVVDGGVTDYTSAALLNAGGFDMKLTSKCQAPFYIVAGSGSGVNDLAQLKGKKIAVSQNTVIDFCVDMALASVGLAPKDVEKVEINKIPLRFEMLRNNKIDATGLPNPFALIAKNEGARWLVSMDSLGYTVTGIVFSQQTIETKSEAIKKMYAAYNDGVEYLNSHTVEDIKDILIKDLMFPEDIAGQVTLPKYTNAQPVRTDDKDIQKVVTWLVSNKAIEGTFNIDSLINDQLTQ
ncbi:MAG: ABC transporter substrate-binding protein [Prevotella sp.]|jgi:NitT/TauT family transport system substrate-binding protein|nr:ABC transporter substrate-binding protein [Prevotella sp.]